MSRPGLVWRQIIRLVKVVVYVLTAVVFLCVASVIELFFSLRVCGSVLFDVSSSFVIVI